MLETRVSSVEEAGWLAGCWGTDRLALEDSDLQFSYLEYCSMARFLSRSGPEDPSVVHTLFDFRTKGM